MKNNFERILTFYILELFWNVFHLHYTKKAMHESIIHGHEYFVYLSVYLTEAVQKTLISLY